MVHPVSSWSRILCTSAARERFSKPADAMRPVLPCQRVSPRAAGNWSVESGMMLICGRFWGFTKILRDRRGVAAIEFAIVAGFISVGALNTADVVMYARDRMEVENATEMGAQAAWKT